MKPYNAPHTPHIKQKVLETVDSCVFSVVGEIGVEAVGFRADGVVALESLEITAEIARNARSLQKELSKKHAFCHLRG